MNQQSVIPPPVFPEFSLPAKYLVNELWPFRQLSDILSSMGSPASRLLFDDLSDDDLTPTTAELQQLNAEQKAGNHFNERFVRQAEERGLNYRLTDEERAEIEKEVAENGWASLCRCSQADFHDENTGTRHIKAMMVNLYFEYGGNWAKVFRDPRSCSRRAMAVYWRDPLFQSYIEALTPILMLEARGVVCEVMAEGLDEKARLAAAIQFLQAHDAKTWDKGVRKQIVANKGSLQSALFTRVISDDEVLDTFIKDRLNKLPDDVRAILADSLSKPVEQPRQVQTIDMPGGVSSQIQVADMNKLQDPFGDTEDEQP